MLSTVIVSIVWLLSLFAWLNNIVHQATQGIYSSLIVFLFLIPLIVILYLAEGIEIAVADLRDKDINLFRDQSTRTVLNEIQTRADFFFSQRQIFVVSIISFISLLIANVVDSFYIFGYGEITDAKFVGIINFVFINILVLCFCQVAPKRLALINSERFLAQARSLWPLIKFIGVLNIPGPSGIIVSGLRRAYGFTNRKLPPSRAAHFNSSASIHGYCVDQLEVKIRINEDGSADISRLYLMIFLHGNRKVLSGKSWAGDPPQPFVNNIEICYAWKLPAVEDLKEYQSVLDEIFEAGRWGNAVNHILTREGYAQLEVEKNARCTIASRGENSSRDWQIEFLRGLPEGFNDPNFSTENIICLLYKVSGLAPRGSFYFGNTEDYWTERINSPCRKLHFMVAPTSESVRMAVQNCEVGLEITETELTEEANRSNATLQKYDRVDFPIQSAVYKINWKSMGVQVRAQTHAPTEVTRESAE